MKDFLKKFEAIGEYNTWKSSENYIAPNVSLIGQDNVDYNPQIIITPSISMNDWTYGETASNPTVSGNTGNAPVTYMYKVSSADDDTYISTKPSDAGTYIIKAIITAIGQYSGGSCTNTFTINKANINPSVIMNSWEEGDTPSNPVISGNTSNGNVTYMYKVSSANDDTYTSTKPSDAGTYTVQATILQTTNYNGATCTANFEIISNPYTKMYLTFEAIQDTSFTFSKNALQYSLDNGSTWTTLAADTASPTVMTGNKIIWKQTGLTNTSSYPWGIGTFSATGNFKVYGNIMSLLFGDDFIGQISLSGKACAFQDLFLGNT